MLVRMAVGSTMSDHLPTLSIAKTSELSLLVNRLWWRSGRCRHCCSDFCFSVEGLRGKQPHNSPNKGFRFEDKIYVDPDMIDNKFAHQFRPPPIRQTFDMSKRQLKLQFHEIPLTGTPSFTPVDTRKAIRLSKLSKAIGPDGISILHLKKLAQGAINYLTSIFNVN